MQMKIRSWTRWALVPISLCLLNACIDDHWDPPTPLYATKLSYVNPTDTSGFRLEVDPATNNTNHLILNLVGPSTVSTKGVALYLSCDTKKLSWSNPGGTEPYAKAGNILQLGNAPKLFKSDLSSNQQNLQVGIFQKSGDAVTLNNTPIVSLAVDLKAGVLPTELSILPTVGKSCHYLDANGASQPITLAIGTLSAR